MSRIAISRCTVRTIVVSSCTACLWLLLAACTAPPSTSQADSPEPTPADAAHSIPPPPQSRPPVPAPPMSDPLPPARMPQDPATATVKVDASCNTDADCTVKNVGNCCGYYPACVNRDSPTDPDGVRAQCDRHGMAGVCGFPEISACQCVRGACIGNVQPIAPSVDPAPEDR